MLVSLKLAKRINIKIKFKIKRKLNSLIKKKLFVFKLTTLPFVITREVKNLMV